MKRFILGLSLVLIATFWFPASALAQGIPFDDTVKKGEVLEQNLILAGPKVVMDGLINGDMVAIGDEIRINGKVDGSLVIVGKNVVLNGPVTGSAVVSALTLVLGPQSYIGRDVYFIGGGVQTEAASSIKRDLDLISLEASLSGSVDREVTGLVGPLNLVQGLGRFMKSRGWLPQAKQPTSWYFRDRPGKQPVPEMAFGLPTLQNTWPSSYGSTSRLAMNAASGFQALQQVSTIDVQRLKDWAVPLIRNLAALLILGLLGIWLVPAQLTSAGERVLNERGRILLTGLIVFIIGWTIALLAFALILLLAIFLYWISLPTLSFLAGTMGLTGLGLAVSIFWLSIVYFSKLIIAILFGRLLIKRFKPNYAHSRIWPLLIGVILYALLASIPYLGWLVVALSTLSGLGALWMVSFTHPLPESRPSAYPPPAGDKLDVSLSER